ncbi:NfeD family protein [Botrimarina hoheduenensis]|uniref:Uncharacterized protein n=1 Tax=Botrimarina hoheduenensis TaxID=2528000 RepID=A0A5C5WB62_9BACT|nr:NfeD family protein [Botrimarina hoheduenensis]TWT47251.1 hypothetical protein Pla111_08630 [Botrimarina hoheduenensis]
MALSLRNLAPPCASAILAILALPAACVGSAQAPGPADPSAPTARLVRLSLPLLGDDDASFQQRLERAAIRLQAETTEGARPLLVIEFQVSDQSAPTPFERALGVARFLVSDRMAGVRTIAYLPQSITGHAVLIALACDEIAIAPDADFGAATAADDPNQGVEPGMVALYQQIVASRRSVSAAVVTALLDRDAELLRLETDAGLRLALRSELEAVEKEAVVASQEVLSPAGQLAKFSGREARAEGLVQYLAQDRQALARALGLGAGDLLVDQSLAAAWRPVMIDLAGPLDMRLVRRIETLLANEIGDQRANWICLRIDSSGGDPVAGLRLAQVLADLDANEVRCVAYVPRRAEGPAALVALACDQLVMQSGALLGGPAAEDDAADNGFAEPVVRQPEAGQPEAAPAADKPPRPNDARPLGAPPRLPDLKRDQDSLIASVRGALADKAERPWSLLAATVTSGPALQRYTHRETGETREMNPTELAEQTEPEAWQPGATIVAAGETLTLSTDTAVALGIAWREVDQADDLVELYGFESLPPTAEPNWALELVEGLASPGLAALLLVIGVVGLYIELSTPGLGLGGFVASLAFLLFFWSKFLNGTADWLEALLFVAGVVFLLIEVLVLPGFGVFGLGGGLMILAALVLAGQTFLLPKTSAQLDELRDSLATVAGASLFCLATGFALRQYLPRSPLFRRAMLMPPEEADRIEQERRETLIDYSHLVGRRGVAVGDLLPGGRAEIDGEIVDVIARGELIERGDPIEVVSAHANRVLVQRVRG